ncbi:MAG: site-specific integrase, partial [Candidatus Kapabacteria bacterium]|nr:site-specific integrase [Candidatus Kapabacteria bacterium]
SIYFHFEEFIRIRTNDVAYGKGILSWYKLALKHLRNFRPDITFGEIDETFYSEFVTYLIKTKDMSNNTVGGHIKALKAFMKWAFDKNLTSNIKFLKFKNLSNDADTVCLNEKELSLLENIDLTVNPKLIDVRNMFLIEIYTGLRVSDLLSLTKENFDMENKIIRINIQKTRETLQIPIHTRLAAILEQYSELKFPHFSKPYFNKQLKELCKQAGITELTQTIKYQGTQRLIETKPKYELISSHTARRSFITLLIKKGAKAEMIMKITGHKKLTTMQKYVRITENEALEAVRDAWD